MCKTGHRRLQLQLCKHENYRMVHCTLRTEVGTHKKEKEKKNTNPKKYSDERKEKHTQNSDRFVRICP